jgi:hypothetical protein
MGPGIGADRKKTAARSQFLRVELVVFRIAGIWSCEFGPRTLSGEANEPVKHPGDDRRKTL